MRYLFAFVVFLYFSLVSVAQVSPARKTISFEGLSFDMILVEGGDFVMGALKGHAELNHDDQPGFVVSLSDFYIAETEVTQGLWYAVMGNNPSFFSGDDSLPVDNVSWNDCQKFVKKLSEMTGEQFRLPTEAEWEYAARGGKYTHHYEFAGSNDVDSVAWYDMNSNDMSHPVKHLAPNELGLYDMSGNVWEWINDKYSNYTSTPKVNPQGGTSGNMRLDRGGSWYNQKSKVTVLHRGRYSPNFKNKLTGFRIVMIKQ